MFVLKLSRELPNIITEILNRSEKKIQIGFNFLPFFTLLKTLLFVVNTSVFHGFPELYVDKIFYGQRN